jgi:hypothetical protein
VALSCNPATGRARTRDGAGPRPRQPMVVLAPFKLVVKRRDGPVEGWTTVTSQALLASTSPWWMRCWRLRQGGVIFKPSQTLFPVML